MDGRKGVFLILCVLVFLSGLCAAAQNDRGKVKAGAEPIIWSDPGNIAKRDLYYGPGDMKDEPQLPLEFLNEVKGGASPKLDVRDQGGRKQSDRRLRGDISSRNGPGR